MSSMKMETVEVDAGPYLPLTKATGFCALSTRMYSLSRSKSSTWGETGYISAMWEQIQVQFGPFCRHGHITQGIWIFKFNCRPCLWQIKEIKKKILEWEEGDSSQILPPVKKAFTVQSERQSCFSSHRHHRVAAVGLFSGTLLPFHLWLCMQLNKGACSPEHTAHFPSRLYVSHLRHYLKKKKMFKSL